MPPVSRRIVVMATLLASSVGAGRATAQAPKPVPGSPYQFWDVLEADGGTRKVYFRNDAATPITITQLVIQKCENTRQECGSYPANVVVQPGKTVVAFRAERLGRTLGWSFAYSFKTKVKGPPPSMVIGPPGGAIVRGPDGSTSVMQVVPIDSLAPAVGAFAEGAACGRVTAPDLPAGHRMLLMVFGTASQPAARRVMVRLDGNGAAYESPISGAIPAI